MQLTRNILTNHETSIEIATKPSQVLTIEGNVHLDIVAIVIHAHLHNRTTGAGTNTTGFNRLVADKGIAPISFPDNPKSSNLFNIMQATKPKENNEQEQSK